MKNLSKIIGIALLAFTIFSCSDDENGSPQLKTIAEIAQSNPELSILVDALVITDLVETFDASGSFTVFAPTNTAFNSFLTTNGYANIDAVPVAALTEVLKNHVLSGSFYSTDLATGYKNTLAKGSASTTSAISMYLNVSSAGVFINGGTSNGGASVSSANIQASNGVIHVVNGVIGLPTVVNHAIANTDFSTLVAALSYNPSSGFVGVLSGTASSPFTVFAPTNTAFGLFLTETGYSGLAAIPANVLETTLKYHVVTGANVLSTSLMNNQIVDTFAGQEFTINLTGGGATITDVNDRVSNIVATDVQCSNGVIHVVNKVLLPTFN